MPVYFIARIRVQDPHKYQEYIQKAGPVVRSFGGQYILQSDAMLQSSDSFQPDRVVIISFPDQDSYTACFSSQAYTGIAHLRLESTVSETILVEGKTPV